MSETDRPFAHYRSSSKVQDLNEIQPINQGIAEYKVFRFCANTHKELLSLCNINMIAPTLIYHAVLPQMVERRNGLMLVMASASNMSPQPLLPTYGATKSYVYHLSACLQVNQ